MNKTQAVLLAASLLAGCAAAQAQAQAPAAKDGARDAAGKIAFVSTERILRDSVPALRAQRKLEAEFKKRDDELSRNADQIKRMQEDLDKNAMTMSETERRNKEREFGD